MFLFDFDTDMFIVAVVLWLYYRIRWFDQGRGTFHSGGK